MITAEFFPPARILINVVREGANDTARIRNLPCTTLEKSYAEDGSESWLGYSIPYEDVSLLFDRWPGELIPDQQVLALYEQYKREIVPIENLPQIPRTGAILSKEPKPHQWDYIFASAERPRSANYSDCGAGKSFMMLERARRFDFTRMLIVAPLSYLKPSQWPKEIIAAYGEEPLIYHGTPGQRAKMRDELKGYVFVLATYDLVHELDPHLFDSYILDESHLWRHDETVKYQNLQPIFAASRRRPDICFQIATGTPIGNDICDEWTLKHSISPLLAGSKEAFQQTHQEVVRMGSRNQYIHHDDGSVSVKKRFYVAESKLKNPELFQQKMQAMSFRATHEQFLSFERSVREVELPMTPTQKQLYENCRDNLLDESVQRRLGLKWARVQMLRLLQIAEGPYNLREEFPDAGIESAKLSYVLAAVAALNGKKLCVWSRFRNNVELLHQALSDRAVLWSGKVSEKEKELALVAFNGDYGDAQIRSEYKKLAYKRGWKFEPGEAQVLLGVIHEMSSLGLNLQAAFYQIFLSFSLSIIANVQTAHRIIRLDQVANQVVTDMLFASGTWEKYLYAALIRKKNMGTLALDGKESFTQNELDEFLQLLRATKRRPA